MFKVKNKSKKDLNLTAFELHANYLELDDKARLKYGSNFKDLSWKEQRAISKEVAKGFHWKVH